MEFKNKQYPLPNQHSNTNPRCHDLSYQPVLPKLCSICLSRGTRAAGEWGWMWKEGRAAGVCRALGGSARSAEEPLWGIRTIIKDSTAAYWFACLIICHMLHTTAISHIRALSLQHTSLRLDETVGVKAPCRKCEEGLFTHGSDTDSPIFSITGLWKFTVSEDIKQPSNWQLFYFWGGKKIYSRF